MRRCIFIKTAARYQMSGYRSRKAWGRVRPEWIICQRCQRLLRRNAMPDRVLDRVRKVFGSRSPLDKYRRDPANERDVRGWESY